FELTIRKFTRFSVTLSAGIFLAYFLNDLWVVPEVHEEAWKIRFGLFLPVAVWLFPVMWSKAYAGLHPFAMLAFGLSVNAIVLWIGAISPTPSGYFIYTSNAVMFVILGPFIAKMSVVTQVVYTFLTVVLYNVFDQALARSAFAIQLSMNLSILSLGGLGALIA